MKKSDNKISRKVKSQAMLELAKPEYGVRNISMRYGISRSTLYKWLKEQKALSAPGNGGSSSTSTNNSEGFVELAVACH